MKTKTLALLPPTEDELEATARRERDADEPDCIEGYSYLRHYVHARRYGEGYCTVRLPGYSEPHRDPGSDSVWSHPVQPRVLDRLELVGGRWRIEGTDVDARTFRGAVARVIERHCELIDKYGVARRRATDNRAWYRDEVRKGRRERHEQAVANGWGKR